MIYKSGDPSCPAIFHPIALTSAIGKVFHRILALRLETFMLANGIIYTRLQKGFLSGISGVKERILTLKVVIENARKHGLPVFMTFIDLLNAFGSIPHRLILDKLDHIRLPTPI